MPALSQTHPAPIVMFPSQRRLGWESFSAQTQRKHPKPTFRISEELIADRLRCMQQHIQNRDAKQVLLHALALTAALSPISAQAELIRDLVQEAHGLFIRGAYCRAEQQVREALRFC